MSENAKVAIDLALNLGDIQAKAETAKGILEKVNADASSAKAQEAAAEKAKSDAEARAKAEAAVKARIDDQVKAMKQAADVQKLINAGKEKEAYILSQVQQAQRVSNGSPLQRDQLLTLRQAAGQVFDARAVAKKPVDNKPSEEAASSIENLKQVVESSRGVIGGEIGEMGEKVLGLGDSFGKLGPAILSFGGLAGIAVVAIAGIGVAVSKVVEGFAELIHKTTESAREIKTMSQQLEISYQKFQQLSEMAEQAKTNPQSLIMAVSISSEHVTSARENPLGDSAKKLGRMGLKASDFEGKDAAEQFEMIAKAIASIPDIQGKKTALREMFGRGALSLMDLVNQFEKYKERAADVPKVDDKTIDATHELDLSLKDLSQTLQALTAETGIIQWLSNLAANMYGLVKATKDFAGSGGLKIVKEGILSTLESLPYGIGATVMAARSLGSENFFGGEDKASGAKSAEAAGKATEEADRAKVIDETRNREINDMIRGYHDQEAAARALTEEERRRLEVQKQIRDYNRSHGPDEQIGPEKAAEIEKAARKASEAKNVSGIRDMIQAYEDEAEAAKATTSELKAQDELRKKLRDFEKANGPLSDFDKTILTQKSGEAVDAKNSSAMKEYLRDQKESADVQDLNNQRLLRRAAIEAEVNATRKALGGSLTDEQEIAAIQRGGDRFDEQQNISLQGKMKDLNEQIRIQKLANQGKEKEAYIEQQLAEENKSRGEGNELSGKEKEAFVSKTGELYSLQHSEAQKAQATRYTSLEGLGGGYQGLKSGGGESTVDQIKKSNELLQKNIASVEKVVDAVKSITSTTSTSYRTAR